MDADAARSQLAAALMRVADGDRGALRIVYQDTSAKLFGVCLRILHDRSEAEDVLQDVYLSVWRKAASFDPGRASPITWMVAIARNRAIDRLRASAVSRRIEPIEAADAVSDPAPAAVERVELAQQHQRLAGCLEELEARHSSAIRAAFLDGATYEELAARMSVPLGTMKSWIRRGLLKLQGLSRGMSEDDTIDPADGGNLIAAEYVLGVLGAEERREFERRFAQEPALASEVAFWEERLAGLADAVAPVSPPQNAMVAHRHRDRHGGSPARKGLPRFGKASRSGAASASPRRRLRLPASRRSPISVSSPARASRCWPRSAEAAASRTSSPPWPQPATAWWSCRPRC